MKISFKTVLIFILFSVTAYSTYNVYKYFFDGSAPEVIVKGIAQDGFYRGDMHCMIEGAHSHKLGTVSIYLDERPLIDNYSINSSRCEHPFSIPTSVLTQGRHQLRVVTQAGTYQGVKDEQCIDFSVDNMTLQAALVKIDEKIFQGRTLHVQIQANKEVRSVTVHTLSHSFDCFPESKRSLVYECFIPISCEEAPNEYMLTADVVDNVGNRTSLEKKFQVVMFPFKRQTLNVDPAKVQIEREMGISQNELERDLEALTPQSPREKLWQGSFYSPIDIAKVTTEFGCIRITQERGRYMHKAVDVINMPKSVVWAPQDGIIVMKNRYAFSGNTIIIDHGFGIFTLLYHLDEFADVAVGDFVKRGNPVGTLGKSGYATGYHLHWEMRINNMAVDPLQWVKPDF